MNFAQRKDRPFFHEVEITETRIAPNFEIEVFLEDLGEVSPPLKDEFEPSEELAATIRQLVSSVPGAQDFDYEDALRVVAANLKTVVRNRTDISNKLPPWDTKGKAMREEVLAKHYAAKQRAIQELEASMDQELVKSASEKAAKDAKDATGSKKTAKKSSK